LAKWDFARHKLPVKWQMVKSTKNLCGSNQMQVAEVAKAGLTASLQP